MYKGENIDMGIVGERALRRTYISVRHSNGGYAELFAFSSIP